MVWLCGVDGFRDRWRAVLRNSVTERFRWFDSSFEEILSLSETPLVIAVDIPIGLPDVTKAGGRKCDSCARKVLAPARHRSVFSPVGRAALQAISRLEAHQLSIDRGGIGIGAHAWGLKAKLAEVDKLMTPERQRIIYEFHPEVSFCEMNNGKPLTLSKKSDAGQRERIAALRRAGFDESILLSVDLLRSGRDDFLDACAGLWTAERIYQGKAGRLPGAEEQECDMRGLDMAIWR